MLFNINFITKTFLFVRKKSCNIDDETKYIKNKSYNLILVI